MTSVRTPASVAVIKPVWTHLVASDASVGMVLSQGKKAESAKVKTENNSLGNKAFGLDVVLIAGFD